jgi:type IV pilus assembly protein PilQ
VKTQTFHKINLAILSAVFLLGGAGLAWAGKKAPAPDANSAKIAPIKQIKGAAKSKGLKSVEKIQLAQATADTQAGNALSQVVELVAGEEGSGVSIKVTATGLVEYTAFKLLNPLRLVLDFPGMTKSNLGSMIEVNKGVVNTIQTLYFEEAQVLRLEIGLNKTASYEILKPSSSKLDIRLNESVVKAKAGESTKLSSMKDNTDNAGIYEEGMSKGKSDSCLELLSGDKETISLDFQNANIKNIFRIISEVSGFNVVLSPDVQGTANIRLIDVGWNTALELILENNALGRVCEQNIIRIAPKTTLMADQETEDLVTEMIRINYADITEMVQNLQGLKSADRGSITADVRTNTLILTDIQDKVNEMVSVIQTLDVKTPQVMIESKLVEIRRNFAQELGIQWGLFTQRNSGPGHGFPQLVTLGGNFTTRNPVTTPAPFSPVVDLGIPSGSPTGQFGVSLSTGNGDHFVDIQLEALEEQGKSRTISNPKVTTLDNKEALIKSGQQIPYQTTSANEGTKIAWVDADLRLTVTPHITAEEDIYMKIEAKQNSADFDNPVLGVPTIITKEAHTELLVNNGATAVLGGLYLKETEENQARVPYLHKIPVLGYLFKSRTQLDDISELLIFVTPTIVRNNAPSDS